MMIVNFLVTFLFIAVWVAGIVWVYLDIEKFGDEKFHAIKESPRVWFLLASVLIFPIGLFGYLLLVRPALEKLSIKEDQDKAVVEALKEKDEEIQRLRERLRENDPVDSNTPVSNDDSQESVGKDEPLSESIVVEDKKS